MRESHSADGTSTEVMTELVYGGSSNLKYAVTSYNASIVNRLIAVSYSKVSGS